MNREELLEQINVWHGIDEHQKIIDAIEALPREEWGYELTCFLARAYNNLAMIGGLTSEEQHATLDKAVSLLGSVREDGRDDAVWHYRMGYALYYQDREEEALTYFQRAAELDPDDPDAPYLIRECERILASKHAELYEEAELDVVETHIGQYFGTFENVFHEIVSPDIHVDICLIPPNGKRNYYTLVTMGMGAHRMNVPVELAGYKLERAELAISLPADWKLDGESLKEERWYWPIRLLKSTARLPIQDNTWLGWCHTVGMNEGETYADSTALCGCILVSPQGVEESGQCCVLPGGDEVNFYHLIPLYEEELAYKVERGANALLSQMEDVGFVVDPDRPCAVSEDDEDGGDYMMDNVAWHMENIQKKHLPLHELAAYSHMAIYLRWCMEHDLMSVGFMEQFGDVVEQVVTDPTGIDLREFLRDELPGALYLSYFDEAGMAFALYYYGDEDAPYYPSDIDNYALQYFGPERYHSDEFRQEAYLFIPFDEDYYQAMARTIQQRWDAWENMDEDADEREPSELAAALMDYLDCPCQYYPPMRDDDRIVAAYSYACRLAPREGFIPMLIAVDETLWECLIMNSDKAHDGAENYAFDPAAVAAYRKAMLSLPVPDGRAVLQELIDQRREETLEDGEDWDEETAGEMEDSEPVHRFMGYWDYSTQKTYPLILAEIPVKRPWEVFAHLPFGGWNECPDTPELMAIAKYWFERYSAVPAVVTHDTLDCMLPTPVGEEQAMELALEQYALCPDAVDQAPGNAAIQALADGLRKSTVWSFWWD